jgi:AdoMet-dependent rRNA methyltransferase SPB1
MVKKANKAKRPRDSYYFLAKEQGYRARSAFKLIQLNKKYDFLNKAHVLVDLCAAPGGWLQVAARTMPSDAVIVGVDLMAIKPIRGVITHQEDITTPTCRSLLKRDLAGKKADVVLHDGAPNVGQNWLKDAFGQAELVLHSLRLATEFLKPRGTFITKVFRSADYNSLLWAFHQLFGKVEATKPHSSRTASAEIFVVCRDYKAPERIDPRLLDIKYVFKELEGNAGTGIAGGDGGAAAGLDVLHKKALDKHRQRDGYDERLGVLLTNRVPVSAFIRAHDPVRVLSDCSAFVFDKESTEIGYGDPEHTSDEIRACCDDLKVLGRKDFKDLLKWRLHLRHAFPDSVKRDKKGGARDGDEEDEDDEDEEDGDEAMGKPEDDTEEQAADRADRAVSAELSAVAAAELARRKREAKRTAKAKQSALRRQKLGMNLRSVDLLDTDDSLFSLAKLKRLARGDTGLLESLVDVDLDTANVPGFGVEGDEDEEEEDDGSAAAEAAEADAAAADALGGGRARKRKGGAGAGEDDDEDDEDEDDDGDADGVIIDRLRARDRVTRLDALEDELDVTYARFLATRASKEEQSRSIAESGKLSHGIKLSRRDRLERQALLTEASLNKQLDAEHERYLRLLAGSRSAASGAGDGSAAAAAAVAALDEEMGGKRKRGYDDEGSDDDEDGEDDADTTDGSEAGDADADDGAGARASAGAGAGGRGAGGAALSGRSARWFSQDIFTDAAAEEELDGLGLGGRRKKASASAAKAAAAASAAAGGDDDEDDEDDEEEQAAAAAEAERKAAAKAAALKKKAAAAAKGKGGRGGGAPRADANADGRVNVPGSDDEVDDNLSVDSEGNTFPDWLKGIPKSDREKRKDKLRKQREKEERRKSKADLQDAAAGARGGVEVVAGASADVDEEFEEIAAAEAGALLSGSRKARGGQDSDDEGVDAILDPKAAERLRKRRELIRAGMGRAAVAAAEAGEEEDDAVDMNAGSRKGGAAAGFQVVPGERERRRGDDSSTDDDDDDDDESDSASSADPREANYDSDEHAELLALGKRLKRHTTAKALLDASYNRYTFADTGLPAWFAQDEGHHFKPQLPITREEVNEIKAKFRDIAARPIHKVAEARARKKRRLTVSMDKAKAKAASIVEDDELGGRSKAKAIAKAYAKTELKRPSRTYVVAGKGGSSGGKKSGGKVKFVDRKMKKEKRAAKRLNKKKTGGGRRKK